jgi:hypothetical protein
VTSADGEGLLVDGSRRKRMRVWLIVGIAIVNVGVAAVTRPVVADGGDPSDSSPEEASLPTTPPAEASISGMIDPQLVEAGDGAWAVGSSLDGITMPFYERNDDDVWEEAGDALTKTPAWSSQGFISPSVVKDGATWWLFYAAVSAESGRYCIGAAAAKNPSDGFEPVEEPLRCTDDRDLLDPAPYRSHEGLFLTWAERSIVTDATDHTSSTTATTAGTETDVWELAIAPLAPTAGTVGEPTVLLTASGRDSSTWEAGVIDGPALVDVDDTLAISTQVSPSARRVFATRRCSARTRRPIGQGIVPCGFIGVPSGHPALLSSPAGRVRRRHWAPVSARAQFLGRAPERADAETTKSAAPGRRRSVALRSARSLQHDRDGTAALVWTPVCVIYAPGCSNAAHAGGQDVADDAAVTVFRRRTGRAA